MLVNETDVFPADDGEHLALAPAELAYVGNAVTTTTPVVSFYVHGHLLKSYSLQDLHIDPTKLEHSVSHARLFKPQAAFRAWRWENPLGTREAEVDQLLDPPNPRWQNGVFELNTLDGQTFRFDPATGNLIPSAAE